MKAFIVLLAVLGAATADPVLQAKWSSFKSAHGKEYASEMDSSRLNAFSENVRRIEEHNAKFARGEVSYELGLNAHSDLTPEEFRETYLGTAVSAEDRVKHNLTEEPIPAVACHIDWRAENKVSSVKDQKQCGCGYAFATVGLIESALMRMGDTTELSEQDVIDCTYKVFGNVNAGCNDGDPYVAIDETLKRGIALEEDCPYVSGETREVQKCEDRKRKKLTHMKFYSIPESEDKISDALQYGPIVVTLNAEDADFHSYKSGIYNNPKCRTDVNHAVLIVGWAEENGQEYWIIKNSWGPTWGEDGFMKLAKGFNRCGIVSWPSYFLRIN